MSTPDVTVVLAMRNRADALPMALAHLEQQTYPAGRFEILVADRGSTDDSVAVLKRYAAGAPVPTRFLTLEQVSPGAARNRAVEEAHGEIVLFLDEDVLAGPGLVENHMRLQEARKNQCASIGKVTLHPQINPGTFTRWQELLAEIRHFDGQPLRFPDWRACNLAVPRTSLVKVRGFDEDHEGHGLEDVELAWRLENLPLQGFYAENAAAYLWRAVSIDAEITRFYLQGYSILRVLERTGSKTLRLRYERLLSQRAISINRLVAPMCRFISTNLAHDTAAFQFTCRRTLEQAFAQGYRDARAGRPPRFTAA
ncbi:MAG: hypothetical protein AMXMBFR84_04070 [Candidatus Hydrogenedentota bacterium]